MSLCTERILNSDEWTIVESDNVTYNHTQQRKRREKMVKRNGGRKTQHNGAALIHEQLTSSVIMATTQLQPLKKQTWKNKWEGADVVGSLSTIDLRSCPDDDDDIELIEIEDNKRDGQSETSSASSFDVIDETKNEDMIDSEMETKSSPEHDWPWGKMKSPRCGQEFQLAWPTMLALLCLTGVLGFVIGHGFGMATRLLVIHRPSLKIPQEFIRSLPDPLLARRKTNDNSQLDEKILKWNRLHRQSESSIEVKLAPTMKEAYKQLSLENYKLKKANKEMEKQLQIMKFMSWYRRAQAERLKTNDDVNRTYVIGILKQDLQYLEAVYFREKILADLWRDEKMKAEDSNPGIWKYFKENWKKQRRENAQEKVYNVNDERVKEKIQDMPNRNLLEKKASMFWRHLILASIAKKNNIYNENHLKRDNLISEKNKSILVPVEEKSHDDEITDDKYNTYSVKSEDESHRRKVINNSEHDGAIYDRHNDSHATNKDHKMTSVVQSQIKDKPSYNMFILKEWQDLKLCQQQYDRQQNINLQQQIMQKWNKIKQRYREFLNVWMSSTTAYVYGPLAQHRQCNMIKDALKDDLERISGATGNTEDVQSVESVENLITQDPVDNHRPAIVKKSDSDNVYKSDDDKHSSNHSEVDQQSSVARMSAGILDSDSNYPCHDDIERNLPHQLPYISKFQERPKVNDQLKKYNIKSGPLLPQRKSKGKETKDLPLRPKDVQGTFMR